MQGNVLPRALFNTNFIIWADLQNKLQCSGCKSALSYDLVGWMPGENPLHFRGRHVDTQMPLHVWWWWEIGRSDSYPNSFPCRSTAQTNVVHWDESDPLPTGPPEKCLSTKITFYAEMPGYFRESSALCITENMRLPLGDSSIKLQQLLVKTITFLTEYMLGWAFIYIL